MAAAAAKKAAEVPAEMNIYQRINAISQEAGALAPESKNGVPFAFRGIDGTVAHLTPFMHKYGVFAAPRVLSHVVTEREAGNRVVKTTQLEVEFTFYGPDGSSVTTVTGGLADDFGDRSTAQAASVAYRIALLQLFHLPTHTKEPEETGQEVINARDTGQTSAPRGPNAVEKAKAATAPAGAGVSELQQKAKALGRKVGKTPAELNAKGAELSGGKEQAEWFNDPFIMEQIVDWLTAEDNA